MTPEAEEQPAFTAMITDWLRQLQRLRSGAVVLQAALATILLIGGGLMVRSFERLQRTGVGFDKVCDAVWSHLSETACGRRLPWIRQQAGSDNLREDAEATPPGHGTGRKRSQKGEGTGTGLPVCVNRPVASSTRKTTALLLS